MSNYFTFVFYYQIRPLEFDFELFSAYTLDWQKRVQIIGNINMLDIAAVCLCVCMCVEF